MSKKREYISVDIRRELIIETGNKCSMPNCSHETGLEIHHVDQNPSNNSLDNLLLLCAVHHAQATKGTLDQKTCRLIKANLKSESAPIVLISRKDLVENAIRLITNDNHSYRNITVGPLFLSPNWYFARRDEKVSIPNYDKYLFDFIKNATFKRNHDIRIMFSLSQRYKEKIERYVDKSERKMFIDELIKNIDQIFGENRGPDICCCHTGYSNIDMIYDRAYISTFRQHQNIPTSMGVLYHNQYMVDNARMRFDSIFDTNYKGQNNELQNLKEFISRLWTKL